MPVTRVSALVDDGRFQAAETAIDAALQEPNLDADIARGYRFERERMRRIRLDFPYTREQIHEQVRKHIPDLKQAEFDAWDQAGLFEHMSIDGQRVYFARAASNLFRVSTEALARRDPRLAPFRESPLERPHKHHALVRREAQEKNRTSVAPHRVRIDYTLTVEADAVPPGKQVRAWLPFPRAIPGQQEDIRLVSSTPAAHQVAPEAALQRTVYLEQPAVAGKPVTFAIGYELTIHARYFDIDPEKVVPANPTAELRPYLEERYPHIVFTDAMRQFSRSIVGSETNPYRVARLLFEAVDRIPWAGAREYSTISNISDYALRAGHADCGQQTLLLMTLLRLNGIPARWQSGWIFSDSDYDNMHDWGWLYLAPYGWVPMDVTFGSFAGSGPDHEWFYLGGLDAYRVAFNDDYSQPFDPPKRHFRSETVDLQRGEVEWDGGNLYFDQWDYEFRWRMLPPSRGKRASAVHDRGTRQLALRDE